MQKQNNTVTQALILAAGLGSRLLDRTRNLPKALVQINDRPILDYQLEALYDNSVRTIYLVVGYQGDKIRQHVHQFWAKRMNVNFIENEIYRSSNSSYSFWLASSYLSGAPYLHLNCDVIFSADLVARLLAARQHNVIVLDRKTRLADNMEQVILDGNRIVKMQNMFMKQAQGKAAGLAKLSPKAVHWLRKRVKKYIENADTNQNFYGVIREAVEVLDFYVLDAGDDLILEVNTKSDLETASRILAANDIFTDFHFNSTYFRAAMMV